MIGDGICTIRCVKVLLVVLSPSDICVQVKGSDWLGDQDAIHYMCREAPRTVIEVSVLQHTVFVMLLICSG